MLRTLSGLSIGDTIIGGFAAAVTLGLFGVITNAVMRQNGFGVVVNGVLLLVGVLAGISAREAILGLQ